MADETQPVAPAPTDPPPGPQATFPADTGVPATPPAADASADPNAQPEGDEGEQPEQPKKQRGGFQKRIHELTAQIKDRDRRLAEMSAPKAAESEGDAPPKRESYANYEDFVEAKATYAAEQTFERKQRETAQRATVEAREDRMEKLKAELSADAAEDPAFAKAWGVVSKAGYPVSDTMGAFIAESDDPHALVEYLANNRAEAERLYNDLDHGRVNRALARVEAKLVSAPPARTPQAPPPPPTVGGRSTPRVDLARLASNKDADAYIAARRKQMGA